MQVGAIHVVGQEIFSVLTHVSYFKVALWNGSQLLPLVVAPMAVRAQFENSNEVGVFSKLTNAYCLVGIGASENFYRQEYISSSLIRLSLLAWALPYFSYVTLFSQITICYKGAYGDGREFIFKGVGIIQFLPRWLSFPFLLELFEMLADYSLHTGNGSQFGQIEPKRQEFLRL